MFLIPVQEKNKAQGDIGNGTAGIAKANCAGQGCSERAYCRRYRVRIGEEWQRGTGQWASFDVEREMFGDCRAFKRWIAAS